MEHRWGHRVCCHIPVRVECAFHGQFGAIAENLSLSGVYLRIGKFGPLPSTILIRFETAIAAPRMRRRIVAHVIRQTPEGIGLEWTDFAPLAIRHHIEASPGSINYVQLVRVLGPTRRKTMV